MCTTAWWLERERVGSLQMCVRILIQHGFRRRGVGALHPVSLGQPLRQWYSGFVYVEIDRRMMPGRVYGGTEVVGSTSVECPTRILHDFPASLQCRHERLTATLRSYHLIWDFVQAFRISFGKGAPFVQSDGFVNTPEGTIHSNDLVDTDRNDANRVKTTFNTNTHTYSVRDSCE